MKKHHLALLAILLTPVLSQVSAYCATVEVFWACDDRAELFLNGKKIEGEYAYYAPNAADSVRKASVEVQPNDALGFACTNLGGGRHLLVAVFKNGKFIFGSNDDAWVCLDPSETQAFPSLAWWRGTDEQGYRPTANRDWAKGKSVHGGIIDFFRTIGSTPPECWPIWGKNDSVVFIRTVLTAQDLK